MKTVRIHNYGSKDILRYEDAPVPEIDADEILVRVVAAAVNPVDWKIREGYLKGKLPHAFPLTLGWDVAGVVDAVGRNVQRFSPGDAVYSRPDLARNGTYAEYVAIRENEAAFKPWTLSFMTAAGLPLAGITAWESVINAGAVGNGQTILIHAASGGVGSLAVQLAKWQGATVIGTASGRNRDFVLSLGADRFVDYKTQTLADEVRDVDVVFDTIGGRTQEESWAVLKPGGTMVSLIEPETQERARARGMVGKYVFIEPSAEILTRLAALVDAGIVRPIIGAEYALKDVVRAHEYSQSGHARGKIVLHVGKP